jgi:hypothetical protein
MTYHDPSRVDPKFPQRPTHEDFQRLSNVVQGMDLRAEAGADIPDIHGLDDQSVNYFIYNRLGVLGEKIGANLQTPLMMAIYLDALTVGTLAENARQES